MRADYHIHSEFSNDSRTSMEEQIEQAIRIGLEEICFTDHVDYGIKSDWDAEEITWQGGDGIGCEAEELVPLTNVNYPEYFLKLDRMRKTYAGKIRIHNGLEFGIQTHTIPQYEKLMEEYGKNLDFVLISIHQVEDKEFWNRAYMIGKREEEYVAGYYQELLYLSIEN